MKKIKIYLKKKKKENDIVVVKKKKILHKNEKQKLGEYRRNYGKKFKKLSRFLSFFFLSFTFSNYRCFFSINNHYFFYELYNFLSFHLRELKSKISFFKYLKNSFLHNSLKEEYTFEKFKNLTFLANFLQIRNFYCKVPQLF